MSENDILIQNTAPIDYAGPVNLQRQSIRVLRIGATSVKDYFEGLRTCHSFWGFYSSPGSELGFRLDNDELHKVHDSDITIIPPWLPFKHEILEGEGHHQFMLCSLAHIPDALPWRSFKKPIRLSKTSLMEDYHSFFDFYYRHQPANLIKSLKGQRLLADCFLTFLEQLDDHIRDALIEPNRSWLRMEPVIEYIREHLDHNISIDELAQHINVSSDHFTRLFKRLIGQTPIQYIIHQRVSRACELLCDSELNMDDIAVRCGFPNRRYLSRRFTEVLGMPPSHYRKHI